MGPSRSSGTLHGLRGTMFHCGGCKRRFGQQQWLRSHCSMKPKYSTCRNWYDLVFVPTLKSGAARELRKSSERRSRVLNDNAVIDGPSDRNEIRNSPHGVHQLEEPTIETSFLGEGEGEGFARVSDDRPDFTMDPSNVNLSGGDALGDKDESSSSSSDSEDEDVSEVLRRLATDSEIVECRDEDMTFSRIARTEYYPGAALTYGKGTTFLESFSDDQYAHQRADNKYFPLTTRAEWEFTSILMRMHCSLAEKTELLNTSLMKEANLSYKTAQMANKLIDMLPSGPKWRSKRIEVEGYQTAEPIVLYMRESDKCVEYLLSNPLFADHINFVPVKHYTSSDKQIFKEPVSGMQAWETQDALPPGATRIGIGLASDGTLLTSGTGDLEAHPLLMTLDNIESSVRRKSSNHAFILLALLPKVKFVDVKDKKIMRTLGDRVFHGCLRMVLKPLRDIAKYGKLMTDPLGQLRNCFTVLSMYMVDMPEATKLAGVISLTSPNTMASRKDFGLSKRCSPRWLAETKRAIGEIKERAHPYNDIRRFVNLSHKQRLTGVVSLVWDDWPHCEPSVALAFDILHGGHKYWKDHMFKWAKKAIGSKELDFRYKALHPRQGLKYFRKGVTGLSKTGGRDHRNMQRYIICVLDGGVPSEFLKLIRTHLDYFYISQGSEISEDDLNEIDELLKEFHENKGIVHTNKYRKTEGWGIPKLESQLNIIPTIVAIGTLKGCSTDQSEHEHIQQVKDPFRSTNHKDFQSQMVVKLSRLEGMRHFDVATALESMGDASTRLDPERFAMDLDENGECIWLNGLPTIQNLRDCGRRAPHTDYFALVNAVKNSPNESRYAKRLRTFIATPFTAIHLNRDPSIGGMSLEGAAETFQLPDLVHAIQNYYSEKMNPTRQAGPVLFRPSGSRDMQTLEFDTIRVWFSLKVQTKSLQEPGRVNKASTIFAMPPEESQDRETCITGYRAWTMGRYDCALFLNDVKRPFSGRANLEDHCIGQVRMIFQPIGRPDVSFPYLVYAQRFDCTTVPARVRPDSGMYRLKRAIRRENGSNIRLGAVVEAIHIRSAIDVAPFFDKEAHNGLNCVNSLEISQRFNLNKYSDKDTFELFRE